MISLSPLYFFALGYFCLRPSLARFWTGAFASLAGGLLANHFLLLLFSLRVASLIGGLGALAGAIALYRARRAISRPEVLGWAICLGIGGAYFWHAIAEPIHGPDPLVIWFLQAKQIYYAGAVRFDLIGRRDLATQHLDYPKLVPALAAQACALAGRWNDPLAKISGGLLAFGAVVGLAGFARLRVAFLFLILGALLFLGEWAWSSNIDGYFALYAALAALFLGRDQEGDRVAGVLALGVLLNLKNEGVAVVLCAAIAWVIFSKRKWALPTRPELRAFALVAVTVIAWWARKRQWELPCDLSYGLDAWRRAFARLRDAGARGEIVAYLWTLRHASSLALLALASVACFFRGIRTRGALFSGSFAILYWSCLVVVYFTTPHDLDWHLRTSAYRTMLPVFLVGFVACYFWIAAEAGAPSQSITPIPKPSC